MRHDFEILAGYLDRTEPEVEGRALQEPPEPIKLKLRQFARGTLPPAEQADLVSQLDQNRNWIALLEREVKTRRPQRPTGNTAR